MSFGHGESEFGGPDHLNEDEAAIEAKAERYAQQHADDPPSGLTSFFRRLLPRGRDEKSSQQETRKGTQR